jgi:hypothetical protein
MWFAAMEEPEDNPWLLTLAEKLLEGNRAILSLMESAPFSEKPPRFLRARLYEYHFTKRGEASQDWWRRKELGIYLPPLTLKEGRIQPATPSPDFEPLQ